MDYRKIYFDLITKRLKEPAAGSFEKHHILPKSIFGEGKIVCLTPREHFIAHKLLVKIFPDGVCRLKMLRALMIMSTTRDGLRLNSRTFEAAREANRYLSIHHNPAKRKEVRHKISMKKKGKSRPDMKGKSFMGASDEVVQEIKEKISIAKTGKKIDYPKNRKSREPNADTFAAISQGRRRQLDGISTLDDLEIYDKISKFKIYSKRGSFNSNIATILKIRGESIEKYFNRKDEEWVLKNRSEILAMRN